MPQISVWLYVRKMRCAEGFFFIFECWYVREVGEKGVGRKGVGSGRKGERRGMGKGCAYVDVYLAIKYHFEIYVLSLYVVVLLRININHRQLISSLRHIIGCIHSLFYRLVECLVGFHFRSIWLQCTFGCSDKQCLKPVLILHSFDTRLM